MQSDKSSNLSILVLGGIDNRNVSKVALQLTKCHFADISVVWLLSKIMILIPLGREVYAYYTIAASRQR